VTVLIPVLTDYPLVFAFMGDMLAAGFFLALAGFFAAQVGRSVLPGKGMVVLVRGAERNPVIFAMSTFYGFLALATFLPLTWIVVTRFTASDPGFRVPSRFTFEQSLQVAQPASPLRYLADVFLGVVRAYSVIEKQARDFLDHLIEMNSTRVQSDVVNRVQESRGQLEVEIRKLLHEVSRIAENALDRARLAKAEGASAVERALTRLDAAEVSLRKLSGPDDEAK
jgi:hypothetical protein